jgi:hypothetical protein
MAAWAGSGCPGPGASDTTSGKGTRMISRKTAGQSDGDKRVTASGDESIPHSPEDAATESAPRNPFEPLTRDLAALRAYAEHYLAAQSGALTARIKKAAVWAMVGMGVLAGGLTALIAAVVMVLRGAATGIGQALGGEYAWTGDLIVGGSVLLGMALAAAAGIFCWQSISRRRVRDQYERRRQRERNAFGEDAAQRAAS